MMIVADGVEYSAENASQIPPDVENIDYKLKYKDMFYNSMLYHCYIGYSGEEAVCTGEAENKKY